MLGKARVGQHLPAIAADREHPARFDMVVAVEFEHALLPRNRPAIADRLSVILALAFQPVELEQTIRRRMEGDTVELFLHRLVADAERTAGDEARVEEAGGFGERQEVAPIERTRQAFAVQDGIVAQVFGHAALAVDVAEIELAAWFQQAMRRFEHGAFVGDEIDHAVRDDDVEMPFRQVEIAQFLDIAFEEADVRFVIAEALAVPVLVPARDGELFGRGIHAGDRAFRSHQLGQDIGILPAARSQIQHMAARNRLRSDEAAAVIARLHFLVHIAQRRQDFGRGRFHCAAGIGLQVGRSGQNLAVIVLRVFEVHRVRPLLACVRVPVRIASFIG